MSLLTRILNMVKIGRKLTKHLEVVLFRNIFSRTTILPDFTINTPVYTRNKRKDLTNTDYESALAEHAATSNHVIDWDSVKVLEQEHNWRLRGIKEAIQIRSKPTLPQQTTGGERCASQCLGLPPEPTALSGTTAVPTSP